MSTEARVHYEQVAMVHSVASAYIVWLRVDDTRGVTYDIRRFGKNDEPGPLVRENIASFIETMVLVAVHVEDDMTWDQTGQPVLTLNTPDENVTV